MTPGATSDPWLPRIGALSEAQRRALGRMIAGDEGAVAGRGILTAYLSLRDAEIDGRALKDFLARTLPEHMIPARFVVLDQLPRTPAGKLDRQGVVSAGGTELGTGTSDVVAPRNEVEAALVRIWRDVLGVDEVSVHDDFFEIGGDSLLSIRVISRAGREGIRITPQSFFQAPTIAELATRAGGPEVAAEQGVVVGTAPLTPIQHWFFERITRHPHHWNQAVLLRPPRGAGPEGIRSALRALLAHHDALRTRFVWVDGERRQEFPPLTEDLPFRTIDLTGTPEGERERVMVSHADQEHGSLDLDEGRLFRAVYFDGGPDFRRLLLVAHHLVIDAESWGIVLEDLSALVAGGREDAGRSLPRKTTSALAWAEALTEAAGSPDVASMAERWIHATATGTEAAPGAADPSSTVGADPPGVGTFRVSLGEAATAGLKERAAGGPGMALQELILASVLLGWCRWTGRSGLRFDVEGHGRDVVSGGLDASRTVGWFTTVFPLSVVLAELTPQDCLRAVRDAFRSLPLRGGSHGLLRYLHPDPAVRASLGDLPPSDLLFNYLGSVSGRLPPDSPLEWARESTGPARPPDTLPAYPLEVNAYLENDGLVLDVTYDRAAHADSAVRALEAALHTALVEGGRPQADAPPSFDLAGLDAGGLQRVSDLLAEIDEG